MTYSLTRGARDRQTVSSTAWRKKIGFGFEPSGTRLPGVLSSSRRMAFAEIVSSTTANVSEPMAATLGRNIELMLSSRISD